MIKLNWIKSFFIGEKDKISSKKYFLTIISLVTSIFLLVLSVVHFLMGLNIAPAILAGSSSLIIFVIYYFIRFRNSLFYTKLILTCYGLILLDITWYSKFLSNGPVLFFIMIFAALVIWIWDGKALLILLFLYFLNWGALFFIDYNAAEKLFVYPSYQTRTVDIFLSFLLYTCLLIFLLYVIKKEFVCQKEKAIRSDKLKSAFLANMSHEIRTPMNGILGFSELLKNPELTEEAKKEYIDIIEKSGHRMLGIINDIIDISKIESGLMGLHTKESNINAQLDYVYDFFKTDANHKRLQFSITKDLPDSSCNIIVDQEKLYAILINLVKNAFKFTDEGFIKLGYKLKNKKEKDLLVFYVKDSGIGINEEKQKEIFKRFVQAEISDKMTRQGAGLGLAISQAYVQMLDGKIWLESKEGEGSTFFFTIPYILDE